MTPERYVCDPMWGPDPDCGNYFSSKLQEEKKQSISFINKN